METFRNKKKIYLVAHIKKQDYANESKWRKFQRKCCRWVGFHFILGKIKSI